MVSMDDNRKVIIVGGGVGGCCAALFLHKVGLHPVLYEAYPLLKQSIITGSGVNLAANGLSTLALVSRACADDIYARSHKCAHFEMRDADGTVLGNFPAGSEDPKQGRPYGGIMVRRWDIHDALLKELDRVGVRVVYDKRLVALDERADLVTVTFADGSSDAAPLVIGADGIHSVVRSHILPAALPKYTGLVGCSGFLPKSSFPQSLEESLFPNNTPVIARKGGIMTSGALGFFGLAPVDEISRDEGGQWLWWANFEAPERTRDEWERFSQEEVRKELQRRNGSLYVS